MIRSLSALVLACALMLSTASAGQENSSASAFARPDKIFGFHDPAAELKAEKTFLAVPDPKLARKHLEVLTAAPHFAGTPEDRRTAEYVLQKYREAGLDAQLQEYKVWMGVPLDIRVDIVQPADVILHGPSAERVSDDPFQNDPRILPAFNEYSPSGELTAEVVYANYGRPQDFKTLHDMGVDLKGKIVIVRYGENFRGVKPFLAAEYGAAGVILYSDPADDGYYKGDVYPKGPWRPATGVQRGSVQYLFRYPGDPTTPGIASVPDLPESKRTPPEKCVDLPRIPVTPLSSADAAPILANLGGAETPRAWQGALPFTYHVGPGPVKVHMALKFVYAYTTIWDVIGTIRGSQWPNEWVVTGNHRDAWVYGAVDPNSGTAAQLEAVHGIGELLKSGWRPRRTIVFASWDGEEEGLLGSTEYAEQHEKDLSRAVAYFNMDVAVGGPNFAASAVPSLKEYLRDVTKAVPSPQGGSVYDRWQVTQQKQDEKQPQPAAMAGDDVAVHNLGGGSDYGAFLQHLGVPSADIGSTGPYGVYHSAFDDFTWFTKFADPTFAYEQEMARVYGITVMRMAQAEVLPYDYEEYGKEISQYLRASEAKAKATFGERGPSFAEALNASRRLQTAGANALKVQSKATGSAGVLNLLLRNTERAFLIAGLPGRPWFKHAIYAPGEHTGYAAVVIPGVNEAIDNNNLELTTQQLQVLAAALNKAAGILELAK